MYAVRLLGSPGELEVGVVTAFIGAPIFNLINYENENACIMINESSESYYDRQSQRDVGVL